MSDNLYNVALKQLRSSEISGFLVNVLTNSFTGLADAYFTSLNVVHLTGSETITGLKVFVINPTVPYSGASGQAPSRQYVDTGDYYLQSQISLLTNPIHISGSELVSGEKNFYKIVINSGRATGLFEVPYPISDSGAVPLGYLNTQLNSISNGLFVNITGNQIVSGIKSFFNGGSVYIPTATNLSGGVPLSQLDSTGNNILNNLTSTGANLQSQINAIDLSAAANVTGFGGVLTLNASSGNIFLQGRGSTTVTTNGNIINISGHTPTPYTGVLVGKVNVLSGIDRQFIQYPQNYTLAPTVFTQLINSGAPILSCVVSGESVSGFNIVLSTSTNSSGYRLNYWASTGTGTIINTIQGEQGLPGESGASVVGPTGPAATTFNYNINYYTQTIVTGSGIWEQFVSQDFVMTGISIGVVQSGSGISLMGTTYQRAINNSRIDITDFNLTSGQYYTGINFNDTIGPVSIFSQRRIGIDLLRSISGASKLSITLAGYTI